MKGLVSKVSKIIDLSQHVKSATGANYAKRDNA
jgi:hypothetical protein